MAARVYLCAIKVWEGEKEASVKRERREVGGGASRGGKTRIPRVEARLGASGETMKAGCTIRSFDGVQDRTKSRATGGRESGGSARDRTTTKRSAISYDPPRETIRAG